MTNPPDFVMYVVLYKPKGKEFIPYWEADASGVHAMGYFTKVDANRRLKAVQMTWGKENAYVQQYGPYS